MTRDNKASYPEIFSNEYVVNVENVRINFITQEALINNIKRPYSTFMHVHTVYEMFLCEKGEIHANVEDQKLSFKAGEALIVPPKVYHSITGGAPGSFQNSIYFSISSNGQKSTFDLYRIISKIIGDTYSVLPGMMDLSVVLKGLRKASEEKNYYAISLLAHKFLIQLVELTGNVPQIHNAASSDNSNLRVHNIHTFIHRHLGEDLNLDDLASILRLSTRQTSRVIKENFDCSFKELVTSARMEKAGELLLNSKRKVSEVASMVGYSSERGFYTAFKDHYGCLPKDYRKNGSLNNQH